MSKWTWNKNWFVEESSKMLINQNKENKKYFVSDDFDFIEKEYIEILEIVLENLKYKENKIGNIKNFLEKNDVPRIIFYIQYLAGSDSIEKARFLGYVNLTNFISAHLSKKICGHNYNLGLIERLQFLFRFDIYEKNIYFNCIAKIILASLLDHFNDIQEDVEKNQNQNNPFLSGNITKEDCNIFKQGLLDIIERGI